MKFEDVMTTQEASERYRRTAHTIKQACESGRLLPEECRKSGKSWLVTRAGMNRLYGSVEKKTTYYAAEILNTGSYRKAEKLVATNLRAAKREASHRQAYQDTVMEIGAEVSREGSILNPLARKEGNRWKDL